MALLAGKVAIITGAGRGLGAAHAQLLAKEGAAVVVNDVGRDESGAFTAEGVASAIRESGGQAVAHTEDISTVEGGRSLLATALDAFGRADILINNAGILRDKSFLKLEEADWDLVSKVNLKSLYAVTQPVFGWMKDNGGGVIVNTSSTSGLVGNFGQSNYAASKCGAWGFSNVLAIEGAKFGIDLRIVGEDGQVGPPGQVGEIRLRGPALFQGYTDPELNAAAFDADGYFRTGDLGYRRPDGRVALTGRLKDVIIRKGENISALELEELLYAHPKVGAVAVIGLPDAERGERVCAVVEPAEGQPPLQFEEMVALFREAKVMVQKIPEQLEILDRLPRNEAMRKILKHELRARFGGAPAGPAARPPG